MNRYDAHTTEAKWQRVWEDEQAFVALDPEPGTDHSAKSFVLEMWPYPSGTLHMGHTLVYTIGDILARFRRRQVKNVQHIIGVDFFRLAADKAIIRGEQHPSNIDRRIMTGIT